MRRFLTEINETRTAHRVSNTAGDVGYKIYDMVEETVRWKPLIYCEKIWRYQSMYIKILKHYSGLSYPNF